MNKILEKIIKNWKFYITIIIGIIALLLIAFYTLGISDKLYITSEKVETEEYIQNIEQGTVIEQKIIASENNFQRIDIEFEPLKNESNIAGKVIIGLKDEDGNIINRTTITRNNIRENTTYEFEFKRQKESQGKEYTLSLEFEQIKEGEKLFTVKTLKNSEEQEKFTINEETRRR